MNENTRTLSMGVELPGKSLNHNHSEHLEPLFWGHAGSLSMQLALRTDVTTNVQTVKVCKQLLASAKIKAN